MSPEKYYIAYLQAALAEYRPGGVSVTGTVPHPMPDEFVVAELTSLREENYVDLAAVSLRCWSTSRAGAEALFAAADQAMRRSVREPEVSSCKLETGYNDTDMQTGRPRYYARYDVVLF